jgi:hypothetical protein
MYVGLGAASLPSGTESNTCCFIEHCLLSLGYALWLYLAFNRYTKLVQKCV